MQQALNINSRLPRAKSAQHVFPALCGVFRFRTHPHLTSSPTAPRALAPSGPTKTPTHTLIQFKKWCSSSSPIFRFYLLGKLSPKILRGTLPKQNCQIDRKINSRIRLVIADGRKARTSTPKQRRLVQKVDEDDRTKKMFQANL